MRRHNLPFQKALQRGESTDLAPLSYAQLQFEHKKAVKTGDIVAAQSHAARIKQYQMQGIEQPEKDSQVAWDRANKKGSSSWRGSEERPTGPNGESLAQMQFEVRKAMKEGRPQEVAHYTRALDVMEERDDDWKRAQEQRAFEELQWEIAAEQKQTKQNKGQGKNIATEPSYNGQGLSEMSSYQMKFELRKLERMGQSAQQEPLRAALRDRAYAQPELQVRRPEHRGWD